MRYEARRSFQHFQIRALRIDLPVGDKEEAGAVEAGPEEAEVSAERAEEEEGVIHGV